MLTFKVKKQKKDFDKNTFIKNLIEERGLQDIPLRSPFAFKDMETACALIKNNLSLKKKILIYGDYDADGVCATFILYDFLKSVGADVDYYIPLRESEGYGLSIDAISQFTADLMITVDCGISAQEQINYAHTLGMKVIVTDHHEPRGETKCEAVINPKNEPYAFKELCGAVIAYKLAVALGADEEKYLPYAAIATIADIMPLLDENRTIVKKGLVILKQKCPIGISSLLECAKVKNIDSTSIGFTVAPRINAAGRMGSARLCVDLFSQKEPQKAYEIAMELNRLNAERQAVCAKIRAEAEQMMRDNKDNVIVLHARSWKHSVIGIVSAGITEKYNRPSILLCGDGEIVVGSGRSIEGFDLFSALSACSDVLEKYGGHAVSGRTEH